MPLVFKIVPRPLWTDALAKGQFDGAPIDLEDGYIHFSAADQVRETAAKHFAGQDDLLLVACDTAVLGSRLKWEPSRGGALFPHYYGSLPVSAAVWVKDLPLDTHGCHVFPDLDQ
ncbi:dihydroorotate dehydrogenase [Roseibium aquae]|uniref:Dihydroorotate dehydrogenase n=1 Tax=Roseibium aquae TaxID=1323746 RepID=A0A916X2K2_9HYPH|nr:DUF952 domain-containing protein [Roseibium aquae]GGB51130.1 dihydroorotate dehydrogenase [Roseibium aquae]